MFDKDGFINWIISGNAGKFNDTIPCDRDWLISHINDKGEYIMDSIWENSTQSKRKNEIETLKQKYTEYLQKKEEETLKNFGGIGGTLWTQYIKLLETTNVSQSEKEGEEYVDRTNATGNFICYPIIDDGNSLYHNGCYCFKLSFSPNFKWNSDLFNYAQREKAISGFSNTVNKAIDNLIQEFKNWDAQHKSLSDAERKTEAGKLAEKIKAQSKGKDDNIFSFFDTMGSGIWDIYDMLIGSTAGNKIAAIQTKLYDNITKFTAGAMFNNVEFKGIVASVADNKEVKFDSTSINLYKNQNLNTAYIFLPFNSLNIKRESGIASTENVTGSVTQSMILYKLQSIEKANGTDQPLNSAGIFNNKYKGFTVSNIPFETYSIEWDLMPRNVEEMENILMIITYFQCSCLSAVNLNDTNNMKMILPPKAEMGILTSFKDAINEKRLKGREAFDKDKWSSYNVNKSSTTFNSVADGSKGNMDNNHAQKTQTVRWLKRPISVYVKNVDVEPISNSGGVLLSPDGFPMGVKLKVTLCRTEMTTLKDVFAGDPENERTYNYRNANPFN